MYIGKYRLVCCDWIK